MKFGATRRLAKLLYQHSPTLLHVKPHVLGLALGCAGFASMWRNVPTALGAPNLLGEIVEAAFGLLSCFLIGVYLFTALTQRDETKKHLLETSTPMFSGGAMAAFTLSSLLAVEVSEPCGRISWFATLAVSVCLTFIYIVNMVRARKLTFFTPATCLPMIGIANGAVTATPFGDDIRTAAEVVWWFGFVCALVILPILAVRLWKVDLSKTQTPLLAIMGAPGSLLLAGRLALDTGSRPGTFTHIIFGGSVAFYLYVVSRVPLFWKTPFTNAIVAYTFFSDITAASNILYFTSLNDHKPLEPGSVGHVVCWFHVVVASTVVPSVVAVFVKAGASSVRDRLRKLVASSKEDEGAALVDDDVEASKEGRASDYCSESDSRTQSSDEGDRICSSSSPSHEHQPDDCEDEEGGTPSAE